MKRLVSIITALAVAAGLCACVTRTPTDMGEASADTYIGTASDTNAPAESDTENPEETDGQTPLLYRYELTDKGTAAITQFPADCPPDLVLPSKIDGIAVTEIREYAFAKCSTLVNLTVPGGIKQIYSYAFTECPSLKKVVIEEGVEKLFECAFEKCASLESVFIPKSVMPQWNIFNGCVSLTGVALEEGLQTVGDSMFCGCTSLTSVTIPDSVNSIGGSAFRDCTSLAEVNLPAGDVSIGAEAFRNTPWFDGMQGEFITVGDGILIAYNGTDKDVVIPAGVKHVSQAFVNSPELESVVVPEGVTSLGICAFGWHGSLKSVTLPDSLTSIGSEAFTNCEALESLVIPDGVAKIPDKAFYECAALINAATKYSLSVKADFVSYFVVKPCIPYRKAAVFRHVCRKISSLQLFASYDCFL